MAKLIVALLLFSGANAMGLYGGTAQPSAEPTGAPELNGCGEPCSGVVSIIAPARTKAKKLKTQAFGGSLPFKCYGADETAVPGSPALCDGS